MTSKGYALIECCLMPTGNGFCMYCYVFKRDHSTALGPITSNQVDMCGKYRSSYARDRKQAALDIQTSWPTARATLMPTPRKGMVQRRMLGSGNMQMLPANTSI